MGEHKRNPVAIKAKAGELKSVAPHKPTFKDRIRARLRAEAKRRMQSEQQIGTKSSKHKIAKKTVSKTSHKART